MIPIIGITCHQDEGKNVLSLNEAYIHAVEKCGGVPLLLPYVHTGEAIRRHCEIMDGLILAGGVDVDPQYFGEQPVGTGEITPERDRYEISLVREFLALDKPVLAICRGVQILNICAGGDIYQDIYLQAEEVIKHVQQAPRWYPTHSVRLKEGSRLDKIFGQTTIKVNSFHHQASRKMAPGFEACAWSQDGIIEAVESLKHRFVVGVQWHPEQMALRSQEQLELFREFIRACGGKERSVNDTGI